MPTEDVALMGINETCPPVIRSNGDFSHLLPEDPWGSSPLPLFLKDGTADRRVSPFSLLYGPGVMGYSLPLVFHEDGGIKWRQQCSSYWVLACKNACCTAVSRFVLSFIGFHRLCTFYSNLELYFSVIVCQNGSKFCTSLLLLFPALLFLFIRRN